MEFVFRMAAIRVMHSLVNVRSIEAIRDRFLPSRLLREPGLVRSEQAWQSLHVAALCFKCEKFTTHDLSMSCSRHRRLDMWWRAATDNGPLITAA